MSIKLFEWNETASFSSLLKNKYSCVKLLGFLIGGVIMGFVEHIPLIGILVFAMVVLLGIGTYFLAIRYPKTFKLTGAHIAVFNDYIVRFSGNNVSKIQIDNISNVQVQNSGASRTLVFVPRLKTFGVLPAVGLPDLPTEKRLLDFLREQKIMVIDNNETTIVG